MRRHWKAGLGVLISAFLLWWVFRGEDLGAILRQLREANPYLLIASGAIVTTGGLIRAVRWRLLLAPLGVSTHLNDRWKALNIGFMVTNVLPARPGEIVRPFALSRITPVSMSAALGTVVLERVLDTVTLVGLLLLTLLSPAFPRGATVLGRPLGYAVWGAVGVVSAGLVVIAILLLWPRVVVRGVRIVASILPGNVEERLVGALESFLSGLDLIRRPASLVLPLLWSIALWLWMAAAFWVAFQAFGIHMGATAAVFTQCVVGVFVSIPAAPGFVGTLQAGVSIALHEVFGVGSGPTLSLAVGYHLAGFIPVTALGLYYAWTLGLHLTSLGAEAETALERKEADAAGREGAGTRPPVRVPVRAPALGGASGRGSAGARANGRPRAVIFDFDLTLVDSTKAVSACVDFAFEKLGYDPVAPEAVRETIGLDLDATLEALTGETSPTVRSRFRDLFIERADQIMVSRTELMKGARSAVVRLRKTGTRLAIVSTKYRYRIEAILHRHGLGAHFQAIVGGEDTGAHKPDPAGLVLALDALGLGGSEALYVGDHVVDAEAAMRASMPFVGVLSGARSSSEFDRFPHVGILAGVSDLPLFLDRVGEWPPAKE